MTAARLVAAALALTHASIAGCASAEPAPRVAPTAAPGRPAPKAGRARGPTSAWFAARATPCREVARSLAAFATQPGVAAPKTVRATEAAPWCTLEGDAGATRADSLAQAVSAHMKTPAVSFYVADGRWRCSVFEAGDPVCAMESHRGASVLAGDAGRCAAALQLAGGAAALEALRAQAAAPDAHERFAARVGVPLPSASAPVVALASLAPKAPAPAPTATAGGASTLAFAVDQWVVMPPLGVMLIKGIDAGRGGEPVYVTVAGPQTLRVPAANAESMGMRPIATAAEAEAVLTRVAEQVELPRADEYVEARARAWLMALKAGDLRATADAYRALCEIRRTRSLYTIEAGLFDSARAWLVDELTTAAETTREAIEGALRDACE